MVSTDTFESGCFEVGHVSSDGRLIWRCVKNPSRSGAWAAIPGSVSTPGACKLDIAARDRLYGPGGKDREPNTTFTFVREDHNGTNLKFDVRDENRNK